MQTSTTAGFPCLEDVLGYRHPGVIRRYLKEYGGTKQEADEVFRETLKWLYLCYRASSDGVGCAITSELEKIDQMWHTFLLFTFDYANFCQQFFGTFIHHMPNEEENEPVEEDENAVRNRLTRQLGLVYDVLGEGTLTAWYDDCRYALPA